MLIQAITFSKLLKTFDKAVTLLGTKDPLAYQAVKVLDDKELAQTLNSRYDDTADAEYGEGETIDGADYNWQDAVGFPGSNSDES